MAKIKEVKKIKGKIEVISGLHIGSGNDTLEIGGMDNPIIKNPLTLEPYIPGSSIKGKLRSLMEWKLSRISKNGEPCKCGTCEVCKVFGSGAGNNNREHPTMLIVRDAVLTREWKEKFINGDILIEEKYENSINRITARANPRPIERVIPGVQFDFEMIFKLYDVDSNSKNKIPDNELFEKVVLQSMKLLEFDYLGGGGSRGNGKIKFKELEVNGKKINLDNIELG